MKIGILTLPFDNNYGGNLQRYALFKVLKDLGYQPVHINVRHKYKLPWWKTPYSYTKRCILKYLWGKDITIRQERQLKQHNTIAYRFAEEFYQRYIPHTAECNSISDVKNATATDFDAFIVGSDQVWRKGMTGLIGLKNYMLAFVNSDVPRIAYAVSMGKGDGELTDKEVKYLCKYYNALTSVSVREEQLLETFNHFGWVSPQSKQCLDPTLLLSKSDYDELIKGRETEAMTEGKIYCYILDNTPEKMHFLYDKSKVLKCSIVMGSIQNEKEIQPIEQWLRNIRDARYVVTDSFHGCVFSMIFRRPFHYCGNQHRGNARVETLLKISGITNTENYPAIKTLESWKDLSKNFLIKSLNR